jgi:hypothetical protein
MDRHASLAMTGEVHAHKTKLVIARKACISPKSVKRFWDKMMRKSRRGNPLTTPEPSNMDRHASLAMTDGGSDKKPQRCHPRRTSAHHAQKCEAVLSVM